MKKPAANPYAKKPAAAAAAASGGGASGKGKAAAAAAGVSKAVSSEPGQLWADKYRPQKPSDLLGHTGDVRKLTEWLNNFEARAAPAVKGAKGKGKAGDDMHKRAVLISGPPGIGKTTAATIVAKSLGFEVTEFNASDTRSKKSMEEGLKDVLSNTVLSFGSKAGSKPPKRVIIMDEVDGMGGGDRGGRNVAEADVQMRLLARSMGELIKLIAITKVPIICICNDRQDTKIRSLVNHCIDMRFKRPVKTMIAKRMKEVAQKEGLDIDLNAAEMLSESVGNDIRQCLHAMQMWSRGSRTMAYMEVKDGLGAVSKDKSQRVSAFDGARMIFQTKSIPQAERYEAFFTDYGLVPLLVQQNWPDAIAKSNKATMMQRMARAADAISDAELAGSMVRGDVNHWELLPLYAALHLRVGLECDGYIGFPGFPQWLGKNSAATKRRRLVAEINTHMNARQARTPSPDNDHLPLESLLSLVNAEREAVWLDYVSSSVLSVRLIVIQSEREKRVNADREAVRLDYVPVLTRVITEPLRSAGADGVGEAMAMLDEYGLSRDDLLESMADLTLKGTRVFIVPIHTCAVRHALGVVHRQGANDFNLSSPIHAYLYMYIEVPKPPVPLAMRATLRRQGTRDYIGEVSTAAKTALTRAYNSTTHTSQALVDEISAPKRAKASRSQCLSRSCPPVLSRY
ncbi:P-loop containing nucleoside triphosphate hydrolase protein [Tribonema minus]|uniref:P-loop containing nucleoside triphosphate hydrolase protein n=1 Tax=Tribonema minus TaxID=303371 RepID=A0A835YT94_9STRA|nr:P-loop containing nucleoside triphosphate hydrolase protein [Tribonema minus]